MAALESHARGFLPLLLLRVGGNAVAAVKNSVISPTGILARFRSCWRHVCSVTRNCHSTRGGGLATRTARVYIERLAEWGRQFSLTSELDGSSFHSGRVCVRVFAGRCKGACVVIVCASTSQAYVCACVRVGHSE